MSCLWASLLLTSCLLTMLTTDELTRDLKWAHVAKELIKWVQVKQVFNRMNWKPKMSPFFIPESKIARNRMFLKAKQDLEIAEAGQRLIDHWPDKYEGGRVGRRVGGGYTYVSHPFLFYQYLQCEAQFCCFDLLSFVSGNVKSRYVKSFINKGM